MSIESEVPSSILLYNGLVAAIERRATLSVVVRMYAAYVLACHGGNKSKAAEVLQVDRRTLHRWESETDSDS